ncbi:putative DNA binding domain-containing protein [candidate division KSB1 bacterium]|nr:putative DNA binding domain-containing protein [candidate division KSB1 bacterium]
MHNNELSEIIHAGESQAVEFKAEVSPEVGKSICAFANTNAGTILVGVSDDGRMKELAKDADERVAQIAHGCKPSVYPRIEKVMCEGKPVLVISIPHSKGVLHSYKSIAYRRVGTTDMPLSPEEVIAFAQHAGLIRFDNKSCDAQPADLDEHAIGEFVRRALNERRLEIDPALPAVEILDKLELRQEDRLTYAAALLFAKEPQRFVLQSEVRCARFKGTEALVFIDMKVLRGNVIELIDNAEKFVLNHIRLAAEVVDFLREEKWEYPLDAIREALTNAICHRDYFSTANVQVSIYDDRLEIWNPGALPPELTIDALKRPHNSIPRNPLIANALFLIKYIERWGTGTERIIKATLAHGLPEPEFLQRDGGLKVVFKKAEAFLAGLNERQRKAWGYLRTNNTITQAIYIELCDCGVATAKRDLKDMTDKGLVIKEGSARKTFYKRMK